MAPNPVLTHGMMQPTMPAMQPVMPMTMPAVMPATMATAMSAPMSGNISKSEFSSIGFHRNFEVFFMNGVSWQSG